MWVASERLDRRTCPSEACGLVGQLFFRESAKVLEQREGWARLTEPYDGACNGGESAYVDEGAKACSVENGFVDGQFAEWVRADDLTSVRPADPAETATAAEALISASDDFAQHRQAFVAAATKLIGDGTCTPEDFVEQGGFMKSVNSYKAEPVYFTYCGGMTRANRIYVNAETGEIFR